MLKTQLAFYHIELPPMKHGAIYHYPTAQSLKGERAARARVGEKRRVEDLDISRAGDGAGRFSERKTRCVDQRQRNFRGAGNAAQVDDGAALHVEKVNHALRGEPVSVHRDRAPG